MDNDNDGNLHEDNTSSAASPNEGEMWLAKWLSVLQSIRENDPDTTSLLENGDYSNMINMTMTVEDWVQLGRDISSNTHLETFSLYDGILDDHKLSLLFRELTRSSSINYMRLNNNGLSAAGVGSILPFLQHANSLIELNISCNNIQSEGFNSLLRALSESSIETLYCNDCGIQSIEIDSDYFPKHLEILNLCDNMINADGCRGLAKLLQGGDSNLLHLYLLNNNIDDVGVGALVDALQNNTSLLTLDIRKNCDISKRGQIMLLKLVNDISSIKATLQSNHTLKILTLQPMDAAIRRNINIATSIKHNESNPDAAGRMKMIQTQLRSARREELADLQGVNNSFYSEINPLYLPEVLSLVGQKHGQGELFVALKSSIAGVISTVSRKQCLRQQRAYHRARIDDIEAEIATIEEAEEELVEEIRNESRSNKRRRKWWWGLWGGA